MIRVLHVDPNAGFRDLFKQQLKEADFGLLVVSAAGPVEAISNCARECVDVVLIGHSQFLNAVDLLKTLKGLTKAPIILYNFEGEENMSNLAFDEGADAYILVDRSLAQPSLLAKRIRGVLERRGRNPAAAVLESLHEFAPKILSSRNIPDLSKVVMDVVEVSLAPDVASFMIVDGDELVCVERRWKSSGIRLSLGQESALARSVREGRSITVSSVGDGTLIPDLAIISELSVPVKKGDDVVAVLDLRSSRADAFGEADARTIESLNLFVGCAFQLLSEFQAITRSEKQYHGLLDSLGEAVAVAVDSHYVYVNRRGAELLGYDSPTELIGKDIYETVASEQRDVLRECLIKKPGASLEETYEAKLVKKDGSNIIIEVTASHIIFEGKDAYLVIGKDMTSIRQMQDKLKNYATDLEKQVEKRTQELVEAQQFAAAGKLASMVGHDLRSPLQSIRNATYLIRRQPERLDEMLNSVEVSVDRALSMLEDLRYRTRETPLKVESTDLPGLIVDILKDAPISENVQVDVRLDPRLKIVELDSLKMRRVIDNLVRNALEAMPGGGRLTVETKAQGEGFAITIADTGIGIPDANLPSLFKPFYTTKPKGLGLGLAYSLKAIEAHGGTIEVESRVGEGTTFKIILGKRVDAHAAEAKD